MRLYIFIFMAIIGIVEALRSVWKSSFTEKGPQFKPYKDMAFIELTEALKGTGVKESSIDVILDCLKEAGVSSTLEIVAISRDFLSAPEKLSDLLRSDFEMKGLLAHQLRSALMLIMSRGNSTPCPSSTLTETQTEAHEGQDGRLPINEVPYDQYRVKSTRKATSVKKKTYGLKKEKIPPKLDAELKEFMTYMTERNPLSQEPPIRHSTAEIYFRHATLFCGWWLSTYAVDLSLNIENVSLQDVFPTKEKIGAASLYDFVKWLKQERGISDSYEANFLRGISKLAKFRFSAESSSDPSYGEKSFEDIHVVREIRKLHRDANRRQRLAPRVSDEDKKWLSWPEYLNVVQKSKMCLEEELTAFRSVVEDRKARGLGTDQCDLPATMLAKQRKIAQLFQRYLVLALFATVPDRQRTFRELELDRTLLREADGWVIKHGPEDYKTGSSYGDRPPLQVSPALTKYIDTFIAEWRCHFKPQGRQLFVQPRTGKPFTGDSIYDRVARACYEYTGKKTNPHLLRDSVVTHVRGTNASEKELEALALFMGHSINMQRSSYDRRSLKQKVSPAVDLLQSISPLGD